MMGHTFKKGDLVTCHNVTSLCPDGTKAVVKKVEDNGVFKKFWIEFWIASLDAKFKAVNGYFSEDAVPEHLKHDRDFHVGDWVRYEQRVPEDKYGEIKANYVVGPLTLEKIREDGGCEILAHDSTGRISRICDQANLVKIKPPQEEQVDNVTIEHDQWGRVEGVSRESGMLMKNGATYHLSDGWREVKPKRWVPVRVYTLDGTLDVGGSYYHLPPKHRWKTVEIEKEIEG